MILGRLRQALTVNRAATSPDSPDPRLRGRTYAIPFERVWAAALELAVELRGWMVLRANDEEGWIRAEATTPVFRFKDDVEIQVSLDEDAQTRVDMTSRSRRGRGDLGANARRIGAFLKALDRKLVPARGTVSLRLPAEDGPRGEGRGARLRSGRSPTRS